MVLYIPSASEVEAGEAEVQGRSPLLRKLKAGLGCMRKEKKEETGNGGSHL